MKAFDSNLDRSTRDNGFDLLASRSLSREMQQNFRTQFSERQKLTVASNYFALACPIMPIGLLGAFMLLDRIGGGNLEDQLQPKKVEAHQLAQQQEASTQALLASAIKQKMEVEKRKTPMSCSRPIDGLGTVSDKRPAKKRVEGAMLPEGKPTARIGGPQLLSKAQQDVGKLIKQKAAMEAHLEKFAQDQDYNSVCRVSAQLELLDKALKKLGA